LVEILLQKMQKNFLNATQKISPENSLLKNRHEAETISLSSQIRSKLA